MKGCVAFGERRCDKDKKAFPPASATQSAICSPALLVVLLYSYYIQIFYFEKIDFGNAMSGRRSKLIG